MFRFYRSYFLFTLLLLTAEFLIGLYVHDAFIRPYGGDFIVVILIYCFVKTFVDMPVLPAAGLVLCFSYAVEFSQYFHLVDHLGLQNSKTARLLLGTSFSVIDLLLYTLGALLVILVEGLWRSLKKF